MTRQRQGRKRNAVGWWLSVLAALLVLAACGGSSEPAGSGQAGGTPPAAGEGSSSGGSGGAGGGQASTGGEELPRVLNLGTHPTGSLYNAEGSGLAKVISDNTPIEVKAIATAGPSEWGPQLNTGEFDMGVANVFDTVSLYKGEQGGGGGVAMRLLTIGTPNDSGNVVAGDSGITRAEDLKGKRYVLTYTGSAGVTALQHAWLANHNIQESEIVPVTVPGVSQGVQAVMDGRADSANAVTGMGAVTELNAAHGARFLGIDPSPEAMERLHQFFPYAYPLETKPGPVGVEETIYLMGYDTYLSARKTLSDAAAYAVVKALWDHNSELGPIHPKLALWTTDRFVSENFYIPYHPGAIKFYKEQGVWTEAMQKRQDELLAQEK